MDIQYIVVVLGVILVSMTLHEAMHGFAAYWLGDDTAKHSGRLTLNPIKHIDPFLTILLPVVLAISGMPIFGGAKPVPFNPNRLKYGEWGAALVALAGPLTNFLIAFVVFGAGVLTGVITPNGIHATLAGQIVLVAVYVNLGFFIFNMLPIPPLDGSRVIYALAPDFVRRGMEDVERYGIILVFAIVMFASPLIISFMQGATSAIFTLFSNIFGISL